MFKRLCFILAVAAAIQATTLGKKQSKAKRQAFGNGFYSYVWNTPVDVEFVLDSSNIVGLDNYNLMIQYVQNLIRHWQIGPQQTQVGVVTYGSGAQNQFYLNRYQTEGQLMNALANMQYQGGASDLGNAFKFSYSNAFTSQHGARDHVPHVIIHIGNGISNNKAFTLQEAQKARDNGISIYNVAVGNGVDNEEVNKVATSPTSKYVLHSDTYQALNTLVTPLASRVSSEIPLSNSQLPQANSCLQKADLVFMLDSSSSVDKNEYQELERFLKDFVVKLPIGPNNVQVGLVQYSSYPSMEFPLSMYSDRMDLLKAVDTLNYMGGGTNTADALKYMREQAFSKVSGARTNVPRIGIVITDGHSSNPTTTTVEADNARTSHIGLIGVGVGPEVDLNELNSIVDSPHSSNTFSVSSFDQLRSSIPRILSAACNIRRSLPAVTSGQTQVQGPDPCKDKINNCNMYEASSCTQYKQWATENCARHCKICQPLYTDAPPPCKDEIDNCNMYQADMCTAYGAWAQTNCRQFCGFCGAQTSSTGFYGQCFYKGKTYKTGQKWDDGCDYECTCEDGNAGKYQCNNKCPVYNDLPAQCTLVVTPGECCLKPVCNFQQKITTSTGSGLGKTPTGISVCVYNGKQYYQDQSWEVGCDFKCSCVNANQGVYSCQSYCPLYSNLPAACHLSRDPGSCCQKPRCDFNQQVGSFTGSGSTSGIGSSTKPKTPSKCEDVLTNCNMYEDSSCKAPYLQWAKDNCRKRCNLCDDGKAVPGPKDVCYYQGKAYHQGEAWQVSCDLECACEQAAYGYYRCNRKCPSYNNLPNGCYTKKKAGDCCDTVVCDRGSFVPSTTNLQSIGNGGGIYITGPGGQPINVVPTLPSGGTPAPGSGGTGMQAPRLNGCLYNGNLYVQGQQWSDGCQQTCVCTDASTGLYKCRQRCPVYQGVPQNCLQKADPNDPCCQIPACNPLPGQLPIPVYGPNVQNIGAVKPPSIGDLMTGTFTVRQTINFNGGTVAPPTAPSVVPTGPGIGYCEYKGHRYAQSQSWEDGCDYNCVCQDATIGKWVCNEKCKKYENLPKPYCKLVPDPQNACCKVPHCDFTGNYNTLFGTNTRPPITPNVTPFPQTYPVVTTPRTDYCVYKGQNYNEGQQWYDGCSLKCSCDNARNGIYRCTTRCPSFGNIQGCTEVPDPQDPQCCKIPQCPQPTKGAPGFPTLPPGIITHVNPGGQTTNVGYCEYKGQRHNQGDKWQDGCQYECECQDASNGLYKCTERCARFAQLPPQCQLVTDFANPCCKKPHCDFSGSSGTLSGQGHLTPAPGYYTPSPGYTGAPIPAYCVYHGAKYFQGQTWNDGCDKQCRCEDSVKGLYVCDDRCAKFDNIPKQCSMIVDPKDGCCRIPSCQFIPVQGQITGTLAPNMIPTAVPGKITGQVPTPTPGPDGKTPAPINYCIYKGKQYHQGQKWDDGCDYECTCESAMNGKYVCVEKCARYPNLPPQCQLNKDPSKPCCMVPSCDFTGTGGQITGAGTPGPQITPGPGETPVPHGHPTPALPKSVCVYKGTSYTQGQQWYDGCDYKCVCENAGQGVYRCDSRCPNYGSLPQQCTQEPDPQDPFCCKVPKCDFHPSQGQTSGYVPPTLAPGTITGGVVVPTPQPGVSPTLPIGQTPVPRNVCVYKGKEYTQGQRWQDGCDFNCICEDGMTGKYECTEQCPRYGTLPKECHLIQDTLNPCCQKPTCNFNPSSGHITGQGSPSPSPNFTPVPKKMCVYNGVPYNQDQTWNDGCQLKCTCEDSVTGVYRCDERCARYDQVPAGCTMTTDPRDSCCRVPDCTPIVNPSVGPTPNPGVNPTPQPYAYPTAPPGKITGHTVDKPDKNHPQTTPMCLYHGVAYKQGQKWEDGCDYLCECVDQQSGKYVCTERCSVYLNPPPFCVMGVDLNDQCCRKPVCNPLPKTPSPQITPSPSPGSQPNPNNTPTPNVCVYKGTSYVQGQQWYDGCDKLCICEVGMTGLTYRCSDRCARYDHVPSQCRMVADPKDPQCCQVPECTPTPGPGGFPTPGPGVNPTPSIVTNVPGVVTGIAPLPTPTPGPGQTPTPKHACVYKGREYRQGERWQDGCQYNCICEDEMTGKYKCDERCAKYPYVPPQCKLERDTADFCCYKMACNFEKPTPNPGQTPSPGPGQTPGPLLTPAPTSLCVYKGVAYRQGQEWSEGCTQKCRCDDASKNIYTCYNRCPSYNLPSTLSCTQQVDPNDPCCRVPHCVQTPTQSPILGPSQNPNVHPTPNPYPQPTLIPHGTIGGNNPNHNPLTNQGFCVYKGQTYKKGDKWQDGCDYNCECIDEKTGGVTCTQRCAKVVSLPAQCTLTQDPYDTCCKKSYCPGLPAIGTTPIPNPFASQQPTPNPVGTPIPKSGCMYNGRSYTQGQSWYDGCQKKCICEDGKTGYYTCADRCPTYKADPTCIMVPDPKDPICCQAPQCNPQPNKPPTGVQGTITGYGRPPTPPPHITPSPQPGQTPLPGTTPTPGCVYKSKMHLPGQRWADGCDYTCVCDDGITGKYTCTETCMKYPNLQPGCRMVADYTNPCCQKPECSTPTPGSNVTPPPGQTLVPKTDFCVYKGVPIKQGQSLNIGCDKVCRCEDSMTGQINCDDRCATYPPLKQGCTMITDPNDICCQVPKCTSPGTNNNQHILTGVPGSITGQSLPPTNPNPLTKTGCMYHGRIYNQGQTWDDGCAYYCECLDDHTGKYKCNEKCAKLPNIPAGCSLIRDVKDKCCEVAYCPNVNPTHTVNYPTPYPIGYIPSPGATPYPGPSLYPIGYIPYPGATPYLGPTPYPIGYVPSPGATPYPGPSKYPIGYVPYPGATPYLGPTPYPIGFTPYPGATPYPGPSKYPIGYTPSPGATPYLGPTPYPIGYVPYPGQTPYPGPSKYPIGYTPYPGATPYLGPTPWQIGYTPYPSATPYPGPSRYPIGYTPSPGATPYLGPTPYPIGYTPWPKATPYPGPSLHPIGYTPSPGATPYLGPTPYPIGFIPKYPGATPYLGPTPYPIGYIPSPGATPYPGPSKYPIGYTPSPGATPYLGPTPWPIGYTPWPYATPYPGPSKYPIGYTPFPGATPYLGPTPYPIGFVPFPGATPYPGPSKYPIGYTPSPGATPYLGPTPWPVGFTPSPGATPYPGPSKYPIGYIPYLGATPYPGPTPYPIGYTPYPSATPYPGPTRYPLGYTPSPGATPYAGPTPWPIGYTPWIGATPYPGRTPWPIGYTPYPDATPYPGPSKYPIGYTPYLGATPYLGPTPWQIGYTPYPSATPYPGPSRYPIGYTPYAGATPYLGPTPYPIGYTPWPKATPYPGPTIHPIGYTPYPGATPYLGPTPYPIGYIPKYPGATPYLGQTPYPIGYIPSPGATPYPGPSKYPYGYTPSPGATPYLGPTPWQIGYTPWPGATPYPGPSKYPIGYTPSPGATPYLGPTPYPIGFVPYPGATPYPGPSKYPIGSIPFPGGTPYWGPTPYPIGYTPSPGATPYPGPSKMPIGYTPYPGATPYPGPTPWPLGYTPYPGATPYPGPTKYPIGYIPYPGATPYAGPTVYPIGYTPSPGATPYLGPTPYQIGYTPWPGATPYPGPNKYPIYYTPYPGATPYLGPTPYPIGYTPSPGATPYPGPSKYPIGFTPYPGATPYPGPTPWPVGYTPFPGATPYPGRTVPPYSLFTPYPIGVTPWPGATPYPGPSKWPIGMTPYPGATPYLGPTPYPIGYVPYPGATPYPGPSKYPIGYTPSPGATPYLGATPWPIGFRPYPGATPYPGPTLPPGFTLQPTPGPQPPKGVCVYKNQYYREKQVWYDACDKICRCESADTGDIRCQERCAKYPNMASNCILMPDPKDPSCCEIPSCPLVPPGATPTPGFIKLTGQPGVINGNGHVVTPTPGPTYYKFMTPSPNPNATPPPTKGCMYKGIVHNKGEKWNDGCDYSCECLDDMTGQYVCSERCLRVPNLPPNCVLLPDPKDQCCKAPYCDFLNPSPFPGGIPTPNPNLYPSLAPGQTTPNSPVHHTDTPTGLCIYKGSFYRQGQSWNDGCEKTCVCDDASNQKYTCKQRCKSYGSMPAGCIMNTSPEDTCCLVPDCTKLPLVPIPVNPGTGSTIFGTNPPGITPWYGPGTTGYVTPKGIPGTFSGTSGNGPNGINPQTGSGFSGYGGVCVYEGKIYKQGQTWEDACKLKCECVDALRGNYRCSDRCPQYFFLPPQCTYVTDPADHCCKQARCSPAAFPTPPPGSYVTPTPGPSINPNQVTPTNGGGFGGTGTPPTPGVSYGVHTNNPIHTVNPHQGGGIGGSETPPVPQTTYDVLSGTRPPNMCRYKDGSLHPKGATWNNGCNEMCTCDDTVTNDIRCNKRCPTYAAMPAFCTMVPDPHDVCCKTPQCNYQGTQLVPMIGNKQPTASPTLSPSITNVIPMGTHNIFSGSGHPPGLQYTTAMGGRDVCVYKGVMHKPGESWDDACKYTCTCQPKGNGLYQCIDKCPTYPPLPAYCQYIPVAGQCCPSLHCNIPKVGAYHPVPQVNPVLNPPLGPGQMPTPQPTNSPQLILAPGQGNVFGGSGHAGGGYPVPTNPQIVAGINDKCIYKGKMYNQGEKWDDGCDYQCTCIESRSGFYKCLPKCPTYTSQSLPPNCYTVTAAGQCCRTPMCTKPDGSKVNPLTQPNVYPVYGNFNGGFTGFRPGYKPGFSNTVGGHSNVCIYKGNVYSQGQRWTDACDYDCECLDASVGQYRCTPKCPTYTKLPTMCRSVSVPGQCCAQVSCTPLDHHTTPQSHVTPAGHTGPCVDVLPNCQAYGDSSCKAPYLDWATKNCALRCGICKGPATPDTGCVDTLPNCASYQQSACRGQYLQWAKTHCAKRCNLCPVTTPAPQTGCVDKLKNCHDYGTYACKGQYEQWATENCASSCGYCGTGPQITTLNPYAGVPAAGWTILMKGVAGVPGDLYQLWASPNVANPNVPSAMYLTSTFPGHYKPDLSNNWSKCNFNSIKVGIFNKGVEKASIVFDAHGSTKMNWFDPSRIISSTWTDIRYAPKNIFSMMGDPMTGREFYMSSGSASTCDASGWMMISTRSGCSYETSGQKPAFYYVPGTTSAKFGQTQLKSGDVFAILAQGGNCNGGTKPPPTGFTNSSNFCVYKNKFYTQGQNWVDGCDYNCTCENAQSGFYRCRDLCPTYNNLPAGCTMKKQPGECCAKPDCPGGTGGGSCYYKGKYYTEGKTWDDGCDYKCTCVDATRGFYQCKTKCLQWQLPGACSLLAPPAGKCCPIPHCPEGYVINYPPNYVQE